MDIYAWAEEYSWLSDYMDYTTGRIYKCTEYKQAMDEGHPLEGIPVYEDGEFIGYAKKK